MQKFLMNLALHRRWPYMLPFMIGSCATAAGSSTPGVAEGLKLAYCVYIPLMQALEAPPATCLSYPEKGACAEPHIDVGESESQKDAGVAQAIPLSGRVRCVTSSSGNAFARDSHSRLPAALRNLQHASLTLHHSNSLQRWPPILYFLPTRLCAATTNMASAKIATLLIRVSSGSSDTTVPPIAQPRGDPCQTY